MAMVTDIGISDDPLPLLRLLHLVSPSLPVGAFAYSQGIEWAAEAGCIRTAEQLHPWLRDQLLNSMATLDLPLLVRMHSASSIRDLDAMTHGSTGLSLRARPMSCG